MSDPISAPRRIAVVLFNLGGPDSLAAVRPFLFNLFSDPAIISLPAIARYPLAALISTTRARSAKVNYGRMGGSSPLNRETKAQADALEAALAQRSSDVFKVFIAMRYWNPDSAETAKAVAVFAPDEVVLLPLYPHYSTTTTGSSAQAWAKAYKGSGQVRTVCCYPNQADFIDAHAKRIEEAYEAAGRPSAVRLLFSAHGLPVQVIEGGDPYQVQIEATAAAVVARLGGDWDWRVCYQSKVGALPWLGPTTPEEIEAAGKAGLGVMITPIAFVSEHVETLVELDHDYANDAARLGVAPYIRVPALGVQTQFIEALATVALNSLTGEDGVHPGAAFQCPQGWAKCPRAKSPRECRVGEKAA
jgi:ferrochelatase